MSEARFAALAETYGADLRRWPEAERDAAERFRHEDAAAPAILAGADALDALLDAAPRAVVSAQLRAQVLAHAPRPRRALWAGRRPSRLIWTLGAGWAATACAGVAAGVLLTHQITADVQADAVLYQAGLAAVDDTEVLG